MLDGFVKNLDVFKFLGLRGQPRSVRSPAGYTKTTGPFGEVVDCDTLSCSHCHGQWEVVAGSGKLRGFCNRCAGYVCGRPECMNQCLPFEARLENIEAGRHELTPVPTLFTVPGPTPTDAAS